MIAGKVIGLVFGIISKLDSYLLMTVLNLFECQVNGEQIQNFSCYVSVAVQGTSVVRGGFMTLAGDINETGHLDDGIFPSFSTYVIYVLLMHLLMLLPTSSTKGVYNKLPLIMYILIEILITNWH